MLRLKDTLDHTIPWLGGTRSMGRSEPCASSRSATARLDINGELER
ncbi:hypothetical protein LCGC14_1180050 [marine sediment metagenome]|uniref:Uncharacterized protein n=1 Tax=marine sediment metagenome TaxID=412755 RepID=A0A0F9LS90_9ZZZZ